MPHIKARVERIRELQVGLAKEVTAQKAAAGVLLPLEHHRYLDAIQNALAELDDARHVLPRAAERLERGRS